MRSCRMNALAYCDTGVILIYCHFSCITCRTTTCLAVTFNHQFIQFIISDSVMLPVSPFFTHASEQLMNERESKLKLRAREN